jgi:hypothetical protein
LFLNKCINILSVAFDKFTSKILRQKFVEKLSAETDIYRIDPRRLFVAAAMAQGHQSMGSHQSQSPYAEASTPTRGSPDGRTKLLIQNVSLWGANGMVSKTLSLNISTKKYWKSDWVVYY